ncbi:MAG: hypothetical protein Q4P07_03540 [Ornithinimicrobium sp.]|uniref:hypothetical protein n=1 Tax=Ornithinimicrobium sp. TaxID=1977084 RepID=UPI0026E05E8D|nr:hypothetical protein [Ornithinimicrobium sp.]MDO5739200.1 hypothetical protein [Ornithinimicrobium sp.]
MPQILHEGWMILAAVLPSIGLLFLFWVILKHIVEGDRRERAALRAWEAEHPKAEHDDRHDDGDSFPSA